MSLSSTVTIVVASISSYVLTNFPHSSPPFLIAKADKIKKLN